MESKEAALQQAQKRAESWQREAQASINKYGTVDKETHSRVLAAKEAAEEKVATLEARLKERDESIAALKKVRLAALPVCFAAAP